MLKKAPQPIWSAVLAVGVLFWAVGLLTVGPDRAWGLTENFEFYTPPQALGMSSALTADATGYLANYYNPAGLAKNPRKKKEYIPIDLEGVMGLSTIGTALSAKSFGIYRLFDTLAKSPNSYTYFSFSSVPAVSFRNLCLSLIGNYRFAAISDGTDVDVDSVGDLGVTLGYGFNFWNNFFKLGFTGKVFVRNQLQGEFAHSALGSDDAIQSLMTEGLGYGVDVGGMVTLPMKYLPAAGIVWKDALNTRFTKMSFFNGLASGTPADIPQDVHAAVSLHPTLAKKLKATIALEYKHLLRHDTSLMQHLRLGFQLEDEKSFYVWAGMNMYQPSLGVALRLPGGNLELATYAEEYDLGWDRRFAFRYTISW